ncbi:MAG: hypothetical protein KatS3mg028_0002 [Bacteroidia bacterium]|nr:MAG: hypothetical protein KatS3mg028_0002 [Bacteroidia bacterium]
MNLPPFEITILGTSSAIPAFERFPTAQFIHINGSYILIDAGEGTQMQLRKYQLPFARIDVILISHLHGDHIFGLPGLMTSLSLLQRQKELIIICPSCVEGHSEYFVFPFGSKSELSHPIYIYTNTISRINL